MTHTLTQTKTKCDANSCSPLKKSGKSHCSLSYSILVVRHGISMQRNCSAFLQCTSAAAFWNATTKIRSFMPNALHITKQTETNTASRHKRTHRCAHFRTKWNGKFNAPHIFPIPSPFCFALQHLHGKAIHHFSAFKIRPAFFRRLLFLLSCLTVAFWFGNDTHSYVSRNTIFWLRMFAFFFEQFPFFYTFYMETVLRCSTILSGWVILLSDCRSKRLSGQANEQFARAPLLIHAMTFHFHDVFIVHLQLVEGVFRMPCNMFKSTNL